MRRLIYRGEEYQLFLGYYLAGNRPCITMEQPSRNHKVLPLTMNLAAKASVLQNRNQVFLNTPLLGFGIIGALIEAKAGKDTGLAIFDDDGNEIPIFEFNEKFLSKLN